ncbi:MAG: hypothetical protein Q9162_004866 [Coniocarpon cinnabarinum]
MGYLFLDPANFSPEPAVRQSGAFIMTDSNQLVYGLEMAPLTDFRMQTVNGTDYLTYWSGQNPTGANIGHGDGSVTFLDSSYEEAFTVCPKLNIVSNLEDPPPCTLDVHEHQVTPHGTLLATVYNATSADLTALGGPSNGYVQDCLVYEFDITTSKVLFHWSALEHIPINATHQPLISALGNGTQEAPLDYFHMNSIDYVNGNYLISGRHTWSVYLINGKSGEIDWELNGESGASFGSLPADGHFRWQHFARAHNVTESSMALSLFNNDNSENQNQTLLTTGLVFDLTMGAALSVAPSLLRHIETPSSPLSVKSQGSYIADLENGNQLIGYGQIPVVREYGPATDGSDLRWEARFGVDNIVQNYRAFKETWHATPAAWDPVLVLGKIPSESGCSSGAGFVSWNGATDVAAWDVYGGSTNESLELLGQVAKRGFETVFNVPRSGCVQVEAVQEGQGIRRSNIACL